MDIQNLTVGEIAAIERYSGHAIADFDESNIDTKTLCAFGLVIAKRMGWKVTMEEIEDLSIDELTRLMEAPTPARTRPAAIKQIVDWLDENTTSDAETVGE